MRTFEIYLVVTISALGTLLSNCSGFGKLFCDETQQNEKNKENTNTFLNIEK